MVTITDTIKYAIRSQAELIYRIKAEALKIQQTEKYVYVSPEGISIHQAQPAKELEMVGWRMTQVVEERIIEHISPSHGEWQRYRAAQRRASLLLTARLLLKLGGESLPDYGVVRRALEEGQLANHARRRYARSLSFGARRYLRKLDNRLQRAPEKFAAVEDWLLSRNATSPTPAKEEANV